MTKGISSRIFIWCQKKLSKQHKFLLVHERRTLIHVADSTLSDKGLVVIVVVLCLVLNDFLRWSSGWKVVSSSADSKGAKTSKNRKKNRRRKDSQKNTSSNGKRTSNSPSSSTNALKVEVGILSFSLENIFIVHSTPRPRIYVFTYIYMLANAQK